MKKLTTATIATASALLLTACGSDEANEANDYDSLDALRADVEASGHVCDIFYESSTTGSAVDSADCVNEMDNAAYLSMFDQPDAKTAYLDGIRSQAQQLSAETMTPAVIDGSNWIIECDHDAADCESIVEETGGQILYAPEY